MKKIKPLLKYYKPYVHLLVTDLLSVLGLSLLAMAVPYILKALIDKAVLEGDGSLIIRYALILGVAGLIKAGLNYYTIYVGHLLAVKIERDMRRDLFYHLQRLSYSFFDNRKTGELMSRMINDIAKVTDTVNHGPEEIFLALVTIIGSFAIMYTLSPFLALVSFLPIPFMFFYSNFFGKRMLKSFDSINDATADINARVENSISGIRVVKSFARENHEKRLFDGLNWQYYIHWKGALNILSWFFSGVDFMREISRLIIILVGGAMVIRGEISSGTLVAFLFYIAIYLEPLERLTRTNEMIQRMFAGAKNFFAILQEDPEIQDLPGAVELENPKGDILFRDVTFSYNGGKKIFTQLNLHVPAGKTIALVGPSGGGKTTFCSLIPRFYEPQSGTILFDGRDVREYTLYSLRNHIGIVQQEHFLFTGTIKENIAYGKEGAGDEEIQEAARKAYADEFISQLSEGYDTFIGEKGVKLSGGQRQRLSLARVFLKNPQVIIFDEATSSLDSQSEQIIQEAMRKLIEGKTAFIIAHRLSTIRYADEIIVLSDRGIEQRGSHKELFEQGGLYKELYLSQQYGLIQDRQD